MTGKTGVILEKLMELGIEEVYNDLIQRNLVGPLRKLDTGDYRGSCPFHDDREDDHVHGKRSFYLRILKEESGTAICYSCNIELHPVELALHFMGEDGAIVYLVGKAGVDVDESDIDGYREFMNNIVFSMHYP